MSNLPRIVVVDSSKAPDEQKRTQITIYNPKKDSSSSSSTAAATNSEKANKRSSRVQRRIESSKSKLSSVSAISASVINVNNMNQEGEKEKVKHKGDKGSRKSRSASSRKSRKSSSSKRDSKKSSASNSSQSAEVPKVVIEKGSDDEDDDDVFSPTELKADDEETKFPFDNANAAASNEVPEITVTDTAEAKRMPSPTPSEEETGGQSSQRIKQSKDNVVDLEKLLDRKLLKKDEDEEKEAKKKERSPEEDKQMQMQVIEQLQRHLKAKKPSKLETKWHLWKYELNEEVKGVSWTERQTDTSTSIGWGRRIYDKNEIETEDRERERALLNDDSMRHLNMRTKEVPQKYGLWDNVYDKRVIRTLDTNAQWKPSRREREKRKRIKARKERERARRAREEGQASSLKEGDLLPNDDEDDDDDLEVGDDDLDEEESGDETEEKPEKEDDDPFAASKKKWFETGEVLTEEDMTFIRNHTNFEENKVRKWFEKFREECPNGRLTKFHLHSLFKKLFPGGDSETFCNHIFRIFDSDGNGFLDFKEFLMALDVTHAKSEREKLQWAFRLYDVDDSGSINLKEIIAIMETLNRVEGGTSDSAQVIRKAEEIFDKLDSDNDGELTMDEFVEGYIKLNEKRAKAARVGNMGPKETILYAS